MVHVTRSKSVAFQISFYDKSSEYCYYCYYCLLLRMFVNSDTKLDRKDKLFEINEV